jgi:hypothetical protein
MVELVDLKGGHEGGDVHSSPTPSGRDVHSLAKISIASASSTGAAYVATSPQYGQVTSRA